MDELIALPATLPGLLFSWHWGGSRVPQGRRTLPSQCHSGTQARQLASSPRQRLEMLRQMEAEGEWVTLVSPSPRHGAQGLGGSLQIQVWELSSVQIFLLF